MASLYDDEGLTPVKKMALQVTFIVKHKSKLESDPELWEIYFSDNKIMKIDTDHLNNSATFESLYLKLFGRPTPYIKRAEWKTFLRIITADDSKIQTVDAESESEMEYIANEVFERICDLKIDKDKEIAGKGNVLYDNDNDNSLCLISSKVEEIVQSRFYKVSPDKLSIAMVELGFKLPGTAAVRYGGNKRIRSWHFIRSKVEEIQNNGTVRVSGNAEEKNLELRDITDPSIEVEGEDTPALEVLP